MDRHQVLERTKQYIINRNFSDLYDAIKLTQDYKSILSSLLFACGFSYVSIINQGSKVIFWAGNISNDLDTKIIFFKNKKTISGKYKKTVEKVFKLINSIEYELTSSILLPPELRQTRIRKVCDRIGIDKSFFQTVLKNWT
jgi:hypothetical protein